MRISQNIFQQIQQKRSQKLINLIQIKKHQNCPKSRHGLNSRPYSKPIIISYNYTYTQAHYAVQSYIKDMPLIIAVHLYVILRYKSEMNFKTFRALHKLYNPIVSNAHRTHFAENHLFFCLPIHFLRSFISHLAVAYC